MNRNVHTDKFIQFIKIAQDIHIQNYLGSDLLNKIEADIIASTLTGSYLSLVSDYVKPMLIHCNQGLSRSPSIGMVYLARKNKITPTSYLDAKSEFISVYPDFLPGRGIELYLKNNWPKLMSGEVRVGGSV